MRLAAMRVQFACDWRPRASRMQISANHIHVSCDWQPRGYNLHATGGHSGTICMRLAATRFQDKRQADKWCVKGRLYILIIFFSFRKSTSSAMLLTFQLTALGYLVWKCAGTMDDKATRKQFISDWRPLGYNLYATGRQSHAKPPVFCKHAARIII
jgi:hypothetical protein